MKTLSIITAGLTITLFGASSAIAEKGEKGRDFSQMREKIVQEFDEDGDGQLNEEERAAARREMRERRGRGEKGPRAEGRGPRGERGPAEGRRRGPGIDGERGPGQGKAAGRGRGAGRGGPQGGPMGDPDRIFDRLDTDGDGALSKQEFATGMRKMREARGRQAGADRGDRPGRRGPGAERGGDFDGERFRPNFNRDSDDREGRRPPRIRDRGPGGERGEFRGRGRGFDPRMGPPGRERGREFGPEGRRGPPDFRRGRPPRGEMDEESPRPERRRRGRRPESKPADTEESSDDTASNSEEKVEASVDADTA